MEETAEPIKCDYRHINGYCNNIAIYKIITEDGCFSGNDGEHIGDIVYACEDHLHYMDYCDYCDSVIDLITGNYFDR